MSHSIYPDAIESLPADFRIEGVLGVRAVLRDLMSRKVLVSLYPDDRLDDFVVTQISHLDEAGVEFDLGGQPALLRLIAGAQSITAVAFPGRVKTQFRMTGFDMLDAVAAGSPALRAPIPPELYRIQRRDAFRVAPPPGDHAHCVRRVGPNSELRYLLADLSAGGAAVLVPCGPPAPVIGECWPHSRIESLPDRIIPCDLVVRHVAAAPPGGSEHRIGLAFQALPAEVQRKIQLYVIDIDKRLRPGG